ncbi:hypothetical protein [Lacipirellula limnantheis]|uniref:Uncharacterized protein n=1 Tax=Lacipirellula limnantheis TaxID=2528024 RepID=A0A517TZA7_9BACT|nr:hypothetical protein [Lacipirellula limnantheis]QDT73702.1 hypothetical protein I41_28920 [Lacipirellula limnantheis]
MASEDDFNPLSPFRIIAEYPHSGSLKALYKELNALSGINRLRHSPGSNFEFWFRGYNFRIEQVDGHVGVWGNDDNCPVETHLAILRLLIEALRPQQ